MTLIGQLENATNGYVYCTFVTDVRSLTDYTARIIPYHEDASILLEGNHNLWQR